MSLRGRLFSFPVASAFSAPLLPANLVAVSALALSLSLADSAYAQRADAGLLEEITVTATRQTETLTSPSVPMAA